jgi:hypothetical protein
MRNISDFKTVSLLQRKPVNYRFYFCIFLTCVLIGGVSKLSPIFLILSGYGILKLWKWYRKKQKDLNVLVAKWLRFFLESNNLYQTTTVEKYDKDNKIRKEKIISNSAIVGYLITDQEITIRAYKQGDLYTDKTNGFDTSLSALLKLSLDEKIDTVTHCDYIFKRFPDKRLILSQGVPPIKGTVIPITENISYDISKVSHGLTVGGTGSGKSFFINYKILCYVQMGAILYIADPKSADLSLLRFINGFEERVGTEPNQIAKLLREASDIMEERYRTHFSDTSAFGKTFKDFNLPPLVFVFDELAAFMKTADRHLKDEVISRIYNIILKGRQAGVFMELILQRPDASILDGAIRDQLGCRALLSNASTEAAHMIFGSSDVEYKAITEKGGGYIKIDGQGKERYFEAPYLGKDFNFIEELKKYQKDVSAEEL